MSLTPQVSCRVTSFAGSEQQILTLRNANRDYPETLAYLRWRYESPPDYPPPDVFWLLSGERDYIGMASVIFRPYYVDGHRGPVAVVGDISLDARWRGRGLGRTLLSFMTRHLEQHYPQHAAFVIPTESARRALAACGWHTPGTLSPVVYVLEPEQYLRPLVRLPGLARALAVPLRNLGRFWANRYAHGSLHVGDSLAELPGPLPGQLPVKGAVVRDLSRARLEWRYARHPHTRFSFATLQSDHAVKGLLVFEDSTLNGACTIYDLLSDSPQDLRALVARFIQYALVSRRFTTLRAWLGAGHPARSCLRQLGFIARPEDAVFQVSSASAVVAGLSWRLSQGDKDT